MNIEKFKKLYPRWAKYAVATPNGDLSHLVDIKLIASMNVSDVTLGYIKILHKHRLYVREIMEAMDPVRDVADLYESYLESNSVDAQLQKLWGFPKNVKYYAYWRYPHCTCPKMDNEDKYPHGNYAKSGDCYHMYSPEDNEIKEFRDFCNAADVKTANKRLNDHAKLKKIDHKALANNRPSIYKPSVKYKRKQEIESMVLITVVAATSAALYTLISNQGFASEIVKYFQGIL